MRSPSLILSLALGLPAAVCAQYTPIAHAIPPGFTSRYCDTGDLDNDGDEDILVTATSGGNDRVFRLSNPTFAASTQINFGGSTGIADIVVGRLDANFQQDIATAHGTTSDIRIRRYPANVQQIVPLPGFRPNRLCLLDLENDGDLDIAATGTGSSVVRLLRNNGSGVFTALPLTLTAASSPLAITCADVNADGRADVIVTRGSGNVVMFRNSTVGTTVSFAAAQTYLNPNTRPFGVCADDFNGDGYMDFATANAIGSVTVFTNNGPPGGAWTTVNFSTTTYSLGSPNFAAWAIACTDFDCDGDRDLVVAQPFNNQVRGMRNNGAGVFTLLAPIAVGNGPRDLAVGQLSGDGHPDVAVANNVDTANDVSRLINFGGGNFKQHIYIGGHGDNFSTTVPAVPEHSCPRPGPFTAALGISRRNFDDASPACNRRFGHTFPNVGAGHSFLPNIVGARLSMRIRPVCSTAGNDTISLQFESGLGSFVWSSRIADLPGVTWPAPGAGISLDLSSLPGGANLIPMLNADDSLDVAIDNDTIVDSITLELTTCNRVRCTFSHKRGSIISGTNWTLSAGGAPPGSTIAWLIGPQVAPGLPLPGGRLCIDPFFVLGGSLAPTGSAAFTVPLPSFLPSPCVTLSTQAVALPSWCLSNTWTSQIF